MKKALLFTCIAAAILFAQTAKQNIRWLGVVDMGTATVVPPTSVPSGQVFFNNSGSLAGKAITGTGNLATISGAFADNDCSKYQASTQSFITAGAPCGAGGGGGTNPFTNGGGTAYFGSGLMSCNKGSVSISSGTFTYPGGTVSAAASTTQEFNIITSLNGNIRYEVTLISENSIFTSGTITALNAGIGRSGSGTTDQELTGAVPLMQSSGNAWFVLTRPQPPILGGSNTYTLALTLNSTGGNMTALTAGQVNYEVCGWLAQ